jgi:NDP-sugar pyrophosphorylase family protein
MKEKPELLLLCGGLGSRLKGTEPCPKPLVKVSHDISLLTLIVRAYSALEIFESFKVLICGQFECFSDWMHKEMIGLPLEIVNETTRSGRTGAILNYLQLKKNRSSSSLPFFIANGDTYIEILSSSRISLAYDCVVKKKLPYVFVVSPDSSRNDAKELQVHAHTDNHELYTGLTINTGFACLHPEWVKTFIPSGDDNLLDIDYYLFNDYEPGYIFLDGNIYDIGTPERLRLFRSLMS